MTRQAKADIEESEDAIEDMKEQIAELEEEARRDVEELTEKWAGLIDEVHEEEVRPRRADVQVSQFAIAWVPRWEISVAGEALSMPAFELVYT
jgi:oligoribonuclease (3'-5' exoribonuclease)